MSVPILKQGPVLIASIQHELSDHAWEQLRRDLLEGTTRDPIRGAIIDVSGMDVMDSYAGRAIDNLSQALRLRGAYAVVVGIQPDVAIAMVRLGLRLESVTTARDLGAGMSQLQALMEDGR